MSCSAAAMPSMPGMLMSSRMMSGWSLAAISSASSPRAGGADDLDVRSKPEQLGQVLARLGMSSTMTTGHR
jgi:hypothetical protein